MVYIQADPGSKKLLKIGNDIEKWEQKLVAQFKKRSNVAMATIIQKKYTIVNARNK